MHGAEENTLTVECQIAPRHQVRTKRPDHLGSSRLSIDRYDRTLRGCSKKSTVLVRYQRIYSADTKGCSDRRGGGRNWVDSVEAAAIDTEQSSVWSKRDIPEVLDARLSNGRHCTGGCVDL